MPIYELRADGLVRVETTSFHAEGLYERRDIQRLIRDQIEILDEQLMVIAEEFGGWMDSSRRIDLLCLDTEANIVVVELKRSDDGGHMELQAIRYAAMVSRMTFDQAVETLASHRNRGQPDLDSARSDILSHLGWESADEDRFAQDTRIILAAADFGRELTTAVLWLRERDIDVRCIRLKPAKLANGPVLIDIQQLIPLPEAASFQTQLGVKRQAERKQRIERHEQRYAFWRGLLAHAKTRTPLHANRSPNEDTWISGSIGRAGFSLLYRLRQHDCGVTLWIGHAPRNPERNRQAFDALLAQRFSIEAKFGDRLDWLEMPESDACCISHPIAGGYKSPQDEWPHIQAAMVDAMIRLNEAFRTPVQALKMQD